MTVKKQFHDGEIEKKAHDALSILNYRDANNIKEYLMFIRANELESLLTKADPNKQSEVIGAVRIVDALLGLIKKAQL